MFGKNIVKEDSLDPLSLQAQDGCSNTERLVRGIRECSIPEQKLQKESSSFSPEKRRLAVNTKRQRWWEAC